MHTPIETMYAGRCFRSRLEARWAVFFDTLGLKYDYEPDAFALPSGNYLPDFLLHLAREPVWFEVKPPGGSSAEPDSRWGELAAETERRHYVAYGMPTLTHKSMRIDWGEGDRNLEVRWSPVASDFGYHFCLCCKCKAIGIEFEARTERVCGERCYPQDDKGIVPDQPPVVMALRAALSARFDPATATV